MSSKIKIPSFHEAKNRRQKVRAAGMNPNFWYPVEYADKLAPGQVVEVQFWGKDFALYRGTDGQLRCVENRCAHRQLKLTIGHVNGCQIVCPYHGWSYDGDGKLVDIPHELFDKKMPAIRLPDYEVRERYGLIWLFPGDRRAGPHGRDARDPRARGPRRVGLRARRLHLASPPLDDHRQRAGLHPRVPAPQVRAVQGRQADRSSRPRATRSRSSTTPRSGPGRSTAASSRASRPTPAT